LGCELATGHAIIYANPAMNFMKLTFNSMPDGTIAGIQENIFVCEELSIQLRIKGGHQYVTALFDALFLARLTILLSTYN